jgi:hypothetical protein
MRTRCCVLLLWVSLCLFLPLDALAQAASYDITPGKTVLGLKPSSSEAQFRALLGEPDGFIRMSPDRHALLYGQRMMLIFWRDALWQARTWDVPRLAPELGQGWLRYIRPREPQVTFSVMQGLRIGESRESLQALAREFQVDGDETSDLFKVGDMEIFVGYGSERASPGRASPQRVISISVTFPPRDEAAK